MTSVEQILSQMPALAKPQFKFLVAMFAAFFAFRGKANMTNLHRFGAPHPRTQARWHNRPFDFADFNLKLVDEAHAFEHRLAAAIDASFIPKNGKHTFGLGKFYNGCHCRSERGLEISLLALVALDHNTAWAIDARQSPAKMPVGKTRIDWCLDQLRAQAPHFPPQVRHLLADGQYAKTKFVNGVCDELGWELVSKLRRDANLRHPFTGPRRKGPGRPRKYDGKVSFEDLSRWKALGIVTAGVELFEVVAWHKSFKRKVRVVMARKKRGKKIGYVLLLSTDLELGGVEIFEMYRSRFQIEFLFRDAKGHVGLCDGQMRGENGLGFHFQMSLAALNVLRLQEHQRGAQVVSIASTKRRKYNELFMNHLFDKLGLDPNDPKITPHLDALRDYGALAA